MAAASPATMVLAPPVRPTRNGSAMAKRITAEDHMMDRVPNHWTSQ